MHVVMLLMKQILSFPYGHLQGVSLIGPQEKQTALDACTVSYVRSQERMLLISRIQLV